MPDTWHSKLYDNRLDVVNDFLNKKKSLGRSERTLNEYSRLLKRFFHDVFPEQSAGEIQVGHIEEYVTVLDGRECGQNTKRRYLETLSSFYSWTMKRPRFKEITGNLPLWCWRRFRRRCSLVRTVLHGRRGKKSFIVWRIRVIRQL